MATKQINFYLSTHQKDVKFVKVTRLSASKATAGAVSVLVDAPVTTQQFDAAEALHAIRTYRTVRKQKAYQQSCLHKYRAELVALKHEGGSWRELAL